MCGTLAAVAGIVLVGNTNSAALSLTGSFQCAPKAHITSGGRLAETYLLPASVASFQ
jgi:hypothetical protein